MIFSAGKRYTPRSDFYFSKRGHFALTMAGITDNDLTKQKKCQNA
jgi:hypothetical protein